tara:strand:+ start:470 stop:907 length:438 start_codon:yes stop_codon:yes gene_type:complete
MRDQLNEAQVIAGIHKPKPDADSIENKEVRPTAKLNGTIVYTIIGKQTAFIRGTKYPIIEDDGDKKACDNIDAFAMQVDNTFYIKSDGAQLFDPEGLYSNDINKKIGDESRWKWVKVSPRTFSFYVTYLKTKNKSHYFQASRETF